MKTRLTEVGEAGSTRIFTAPCEAFLLSARQGQLAAALASHLDGA